LYEYISHNYVGVLGTICITISQFMILSPWPSQP